LETQKTMNSQSNTEQKQQCWRYDNTWLQTILQNHSSKNSIVLAQKLIWRLVNRIEDLDMNPCSYAHLIFGKGAKNIRGQKDSLFNKCCWENWISVCRKLKIDQVCYLVQVSPQSGLRTLISDLKLKASTGKSREYTGSNRYRQGLPQ
jgi:hypothetical protein